MRLMDVLSFIWNGCFSCLKWDWTLHIVFYFYFFLSLQCSIVLVLKWWIIFSYGFLFECHGVLEISSFIGLHERNMVLSSFFFMAVLFYYFAQWSLDFILFWNGNLYLSEAWLYNRIIWEKSNRKILPLRKRQKHKQKTARLGEPPHPLVI